MNEMVLSPGTFAALVPIPHAPPPALKYDVVGPAAGGLLVADGSGVPMFARSDDIQRLETIDRSRGARDGALAVGAPAFFLGFRPHLPAGALPDNTQPGDSISTHDAAGAAIAAGLIHMAVGAGVGALYGAAAGHREFTSSSPRRGLVIWRSASRSGDLGDHLGLGLGARDAQVAGLRAGARGVDVDDQHRRVGDQRLDGGRVGQADRIGRRDDDEAGVESRCTTSPKRRTSSDWAASTHRSWSTPSSTFVPSSM